MVDPTALDPRATRGVDPIERGLPNGLGRGQVVVQDYSQLQRSLFF